MSMEARMQPEPFERLRSALEDPPWNHDLLSEYVTALGQDKGEEDVFLRMAFRCVNPEGAGASIPSALIPSACSGLYEAMSIEDRTKLRRWWHEKILREAHQHDDLGARLSGRYRL
jgi:hypothetical protein